MEEVSSELPQNGEPTNETILQEDVGELQDAVTVEDATLQETAAEPAYYAEYQFEAQWTLICGTKKELESSKSQGFLKGYNNNN